MDYTEPREGLESFVNTLVSLEDMDINKDLKELIKFGR